MLAARADVLRGLHHDQYPLVLPNAWDAASARRFAADGHPAIGTTSSGVSASLGYTDGQDMPADVAFAGVMRIARAVEEECPVTADMEAGYGLPAQELVERLLVAGAVGLNLEDSDHTTGGLVEAEGHAEYLAAVKEAGRGAGVDVVLNARVDVFVRSGHAGEEQVVEAIRRGRLYVEAGADCVYPILAGGTDVIARLVAEIDAPVNVMVRPGGLRPDELAELGVRRISWGGGLIEVALDAAAAEVTQGARPGD
jgi:2-methylisocitrate lyase-like PEP mutase family enzyme